MKWVVEAFWEVRNSMRRPDVWRAACSARQGQSKCHDAYRVGSVVKGAAKHTLRHVPDNAWVTALVGRRADFRARRVDSCRVHRICLGPRRNTLWNHWNLASGYRSVQGVLPLCWQGLWVWRSPGEWCGPSYGTAIDNDKLSVARGAIANVLGVPTAG
jgi:hypothetical protein